MTYPSYVVKIVVPSDPDKSVTIDGSHTFSMSTAAGTLELDFSHNNESEDKIPSLIVKVTP